MTDAARWKATVYVGGLSQHATTSHVMDAFIPFGDIVEIQVPKQDGPNATEPHRGFAYVEYEDVADAKEAIDNMDQSDFFGRVLKVSQAKAPKSADEGLGSKTALWQQVCLHEDCYSRVQKADVSFRKVGWLNTQPKEMMLGSSMELAPLPALTRCKAWKSWTWLAQSRRKC
jgi:RNA recognition motif-containing protein